MITLRKLASLPERTRARKLLGLLGAAADPDFSRELHRLAHQILQEDPVDLESLRQTALLRNRLARWLGLEVADWDFQAPRDRTEASQRFPLSVFLEDLRSPFNVGSILRTAEAFGFQRVILSPDCPGLDQPRVRRTAMGSDQHLTIEAQTLATVRASWTDSVWALELGGTPVVDFAFPASGLVLVGSEELGLSPEALDWADESAGRVSLPLYGNKASLNVGVAFGIAAARWTGALVGP